MIFDATVPSQRYRYQKNIFQHLIVFCKNEVCVNCVGLNVTKLILLLSIFFCFILAILQDTLFEKGNEWQKIEQVPIQLPRASRNFPNVKTRNEKNFYNGTSEMHYDNTYFLKFPLLNSTQPLLQSNIRWKNADIVKEMRKMGRADGRYIDVIRKLCYIRK